MSTERAAIVARMRELVEAEDPTRPWQDKNDAARLLLGVSTIIEEEGRGAWVFWRIKNANGDRVCDCGSLTECQDLLGKYADSGLAGWSNGPYRIVRVTRRRRARCDGSADTATKARSAEPGTATPGEIAPVSPSAPSTSGPVRIADDEQRIACVTHEGLRQNCYLGTIGCIGPHPEACDVPPVGWWCSRAKGHAGPCAARRAAEQSSTDGGPK